MKEFKLSDLTDHKREEVLNAAREEGAIIQKKRTNGEVIEEFVMVNKKDHDKLIDLVKAKFLPLVSVSKEEFEKQYPTTG